MTLSTRMGVMNQGRIVQVGTPTQIYESPGTRFIADFIGSVNLFDAEVSGESAGRLELHCAQLPAPLQVDHSAARFAAGRALWVAIRPEKINVHTTAPAQAHNWAQGVLREVAYLGESSMLLIRLSSGREVRVTVTNRRRQEEAGLAREAPVYLSWDAASAVVGEI